MDNLPVHKAHRIQEIVASVGAKVIFLPPYSPDLSPIELCWSKLKQYLRTAKARTSNAVNQALTRLLINKFHLMMLSVGLTHCGLFI